MILQKRVDRAFQYLKEIAAKKRSQSNDSEEMHLEKGDRFAMTLSALLVLLPAALIALLVIVGLGVLWIL